MLKIKESESKFTKPEPGAHLVKCVGLVDHGIVLATKAEFKDAHKFSLIFMTSDGFQLTRNFSNSWGEKSNWRKFITQWSGKSPEKVIDPEVVLNYQGEGYLTQNGEYLNLTAITKMKKSELATPTEVYVYDYLRNMGDNFEVMFATGYTEKKILSLEQKDAKDVASLKAYAQAQMKGQLVTPAEVASAPAAQVKANIKPKPFGVKETVPAENFEELPF